MWNIWVVLSVCWSKCGCCMLGVNIVGWLRWLIGWFLLSWIIGLCVSCRLMFWSSLVIRWRMLVGVIVILVLFMNCVMVYCVIS